MHCVPTKIHIGNHPNPATTGDSLNLNRLGQGTKKEKMQIILIQDVDNLGGANELVKVKNGYARNFLIPRKMAVEANPSNLKQMEEKLKQQQKKEAKLLAEVN